MNSKLLEPRKVENGAFTRWVRLAFKLIRRRMITWLLLSTFCAMAAMALGFSQLLQITVVMAVLLVGTVFAKLVDQTVNPSVDEQHSIIVSSLPRGLAVTGYAVLVMFVVSLSFSVFDGNLKTVLGRVYSSGYFIALTEQNGLHSLLIDVSAPVAVCVFFGVITMSLPFVYGPFAYLAMEVFGVDRKTAHILALKGEVLNGGALFKLNMLILLGPMLATAIVPGVSIALVFAMVSCLWWVAFKDIFLHVAAMDEVIAAVPETSTAAVRSAI